MEEHIQTCPELSLVKDETPLWPCLSLADKVLHGLMFAVTLLITIFVLYWAESLGFLAGTMVHIAALLCFSLLASRLFGNGEPGGVGDSEVPAEAGCPSPDWGDYGLDS